MKGHRRLLDVRDRGRPQAHRTLMLLVVAAAGCGASLISVTPASASCAGPATVETELVRADLVFVGTATALTNKNRWATFAVEDLWKGDPVPSLKRSPETPPDPEIVRKLDMPKKLEEFRKRSRKRQQRKSA